MTHSTWSPPRVLALCAGYGGLEETLAASIGGQAIACAENDLYWRPCSLRTALGCRALGTSPPSTGTGSGTCSPRTSSARASRAATSPTLDEGTESMASGRRSGERYSG